MIMPPYGDQRAIREPRDVHARMWNARRKQGCQISLAYQCWRMARRHLRPCIMGSSRNGGESEVAREMTTNKGDIGREARGGKKRRGFVTTGHHFDHPPPSRPSPNLD